MVNDAWRGGILRFSPPFRGKERFSFLRTCGWREERWDPLPILSPVFWFPGKWNVSRKVGIVTSFFFSSPDQFTGGLPPRSKLHYLLLLLSYVGRPGMPEILQGFFRFSSFPGYEIRRNGSRGADMRRPLTPLWNLAIEFSL